MLLVKDGRSAAEADALLEALASDCRTAPLADADRAMLDYALKLTHTPASIAAGDIDRLRAAGFDDRAVHDICAITAYFAFVTASPTVSASSWRRRKSRHEDTEGLKGLKAVTLSCVDKTLT